MSESRKGINKLKRNYYVHLTGGLGNQLFQLAAALDRTEAAKIVLTQTTGKPRINSEGMAELFSFELPSGVVVQSNQRIATLEGKACGYFLRISISPVGIEKLSLYRNTVRLLASIVNSISFGSILNIQGIRSVGYTKWNNKSNFLVGYFQSSIYLENPAVLNSMKSLQLKKIGAETLEYVAQAKLVRPLIVHVRRGDYLNEESFGILSKEYYLESIRQILQSTDCGEIWVFSDDIAGARELFDEFELNTIKYIGDVDNSASSGLEVMRHGAAYVIGNSTYSWWAAALSYTKNPHVIAPRPWFYGQDEVPNLLPKDWKRVDGRHSSE